jgi:hypothetical protein
MRRRVRPRVEVLEGRDVPTATFTTLASSADPSVYGQPITLTATVSGGDFQPGTRVVQDTVSFYADGSSSPFATVPVSSGVASVTLPPLPAGLHQLQAVYSGAVELDGGTL